MPMPAVVLPSAPVLLRIWPPVQSAELAAVMDSVPAPLLLMETVPPHWPEELPVTIRPPLDAAVPVFFRLMPTPAVPAAVPAEMLRKVRPAEPMSVSDTLSAVPLAVAMVLTPDEVTVPPPVKTMPAAPLVLLTAISLIV